MKFNPTIIAAANRIRVEVQNDPQLPTVDHGESVAILLWWMFLRDHSFHEGLPVDRLARDQLESFIAWAREHLDMVRA